MPLEKKIVMLVDDDEDFLSELKEALALSGYIPVPVTNGSDAIRAARKIRPDAILLDLKLGAENGYAVAARLRSDPATARIPIIMMSGYFGGPVRRDVLPPSDINLYLSKPFSQKDAVFSIGSLLAEKKEKSGFNLAKYLLLRSRTKSSHSPFARE